MFGGERADVAAPRETVLLRGVCSLLRENRPAPWGYDKGGDPNERRQQREIAEARKVLTQFKERRRWERGGRRGRRRGWRIMGEIPILSKS